MSLLGAGRAGLLDVKPRVMLSVPALPGFPTGFLVAPGINRLDLPPGRIWVLFPSGLREPLPGNKQE